MHDVFWEMRGDNSHEGDVKTNRRTKEAEVPFESKYDPRVTALYSFMASQSMFGPVTTYIEMHSVLVKGSEREVVEFRREGTNLLQSF